MVNELRPFILAVIPARYASTRLPGKPLLEIQGQSMISRVVQQVKKSSRVSAWVVATDDQRIFDHVAALGEPVLMTAAEHPSGTDRCAEAARHYPQADLIINVQGDEPFIQPEQINLLADTLAGRPEYTIATLAKKITQQEMLFNQNVVKVVCSASGKALYFSRHPIPFQRGRAEAEWLQHHDYYKHIGMYAFRRATLMELAGLRPSPLELAESLEQLRWLEQDQAIAVGFTELETIGIDTPEDLERLIVNEKT